MNYLGFETGAFSQLTRKYMLETFNPKTPDVDGTRYYSYGASLEPSFWSVFSVSHSIIKRIEGGLNDGLVRYMLRYAPLSIKRILLTKPVYRQVNGATIRAL